MRIASCIVVSRHAVDSRLLAGRRPLDAHVVVEWKAIAVEHRRPRKSIGLHSTFATLHPHTVVVDIEHLKQSTHKSHLLHSSTQRSARQDVTIELWHAYRRKNGAKKKLKRLDQICRAYVLQDHLCVTMTMKTLQANPRLALLDCFIKCLQYEQISFLT